MVYCAVKCIAYIDCNEDTTFKSRMFITYANEVYETKDNKKKENRIIREAHLNPNYSISILEYKNADV